MYPTLSDLIYDLFGVYIPLPIQSFGFMMAVSFLLAAWTLSLELKRKESQGLLHPSVHKVLKGSPASAGELMIAALIGFIIGFKLVYIFFNYREFVNDTQGVLISGKGNYLGALLSGSLFAYMKYREKEKQKLQVPKWIEETIHPWQLVGNFTMVAAVTGLLGAKLFHNLENLDEFETDPWGALFSFSGLTMYGGLICGGAGVIWYGLKNKISFAHLIDATAPGLMLAYGTGRLGCQVAGDGDWGIVNHAPQPSWLSWLPEWTWSFKYPHNVINAGVPIPGCEGKHCFILPEPVFPTPLYEAVICIFLFFVLWYLRKKISTPGILFSIYLILNGTERFFIEKIRVNTQYHIMGHGITQAEIISVILFFLGAAGIFYFSKRGRREILT